MGPTALASVLESRILCRSGAEDKGISNILDTAWQGIIFGTIFCLCSALFWGTVPSQAEENPTGGKILPGFLGGCFQAHGQGRGLAFSLAFPSVLRTAGQRMCEEGAANPASPQALGLGLMGHTQKKQDIPKLVPNSVVELAPLEIVR